MNESPEKQAFSARLREICAEKQLPDRGRQSALASLFSVTPNAARKWLLGLGLPETEVAIRIAKWADVNYEWLMTGRGLMRGDKVPTRALVVDEVLRRGTPADRKEVVNFLRYKLENAEAPIAEEERARYLAALETYISDAPKRPQ